MIFNTRSRRFLSRSLAMAFAVVCGVSLSTLAQAQMATGSGCINCGGGSAPTVAYSNPAPLQHSQPMVQPSYPVSTTANQSYPSGSYSGFTSTPQQCCSAPRRSVSRCGHAHRSCATRHSSARVCTSTPTYSATPVHSNTAVHSGGGCCSGSRVSTTVNSYPTSGVRHQMNVTPVSAPVMATGAGCVSGNCQ